MKYNYICIGKNRMLWLAFLTVIMTVFSFTSRTHSCVKAAGTDSGNIMVFDFEDEGSETGWHSLVGNVRIQRDDTQSATGDYSLKADERQTNFDGPAFDIIDSVEPDNDYLVSFSIMYDGPTEDYLRLSMRITYKDGSIRFENPFTINNPLKKEWRKFDTQIYIPADAAKVEIYFESSIKESTLWIDDISVSETEKESKTDHTSLTSSGTSKYDFEKYIDAGFWPMRDADIARSESTASSGTYSLRIKNRNDSRDGVFFELSPLERNKTYRFCTALTFVDNYVTHEHFSVYLRYNTSATSFIDIPVVPDHDITRGLWSSMGGNFTIPAEAIDPIIYITSVKPPDEYNYTHVSFFIDDFVITDDLETTADRLQSRRRLIIILLSSFSAACALAAFVIMFINRRKIQRKLEESYKDSMTGAYNRNAYEQYIKMLTAKPKKCKNLFIAVCDVNGLKFLNDNYGHHTGDSCIIKCAHLLSEVMNETGGKVYRTGGDEFVCFANCDFKKQLREKIKNEEENFTEYPFSVAVGFSSWNPYEDTEKPAIKKLLARCDKEMYIDKKKAKDKKVQN